MDWVYGDFRTTIGKKCWALESRHKFDRLNGKIMANRHIAKVVVNQFNGYVTFERFNKWVFDNIPRCLTDGTTNPEWRYYQYDGRYRGSIEYEALPISGITMYNILRRMDDPYNGSLDEVVEKILSENNQLRDSLMKIGTEGGLTFDRQRMLLDHVIREIESGLKLLREI